MTTFTYNGPTKKIRLNGQLFEKGKSIETDDHILVAKLKEHPKFSEGTKEKEEPKAKKS